MGEKWSRLAEDRTTAKAASVRQSRRTKLITPTVSVVSARYLPIGNANTDTDTFTDTA